MERSVLVLADTQLVSGIAILVAGYSQLHCGVSAYHWQIVVYVAWFASFSFLSSMTFLQDYFNSNDNMRVLRLCFLVVLATLQIVALLPTGSKDFLNLYQQGQYIPGLDAACYFKQLTMKGFTTRGGPKVWSMVFSVFVIAATYVSCAFRLYDQGAGTAYKYFRVWPGTKLKEGLRSLEHKALQKGFRATLWHVPYLLYYASFTICRAGDDLLGSMLMEVIWLTFAMGWGSIKILTTRAVGQKSFEGHHITLDHRIEGEDQWGFGQILPLVLILLPILSMAQAYLDNDAKARESEERVEAEERAEDARITAEEKRRSSKDEAEEIPVIRVTRDARQIGPDMIESSSSSMHNTICPSRRKSSVLHTATMEPESEEPPTSISESSSVQLPQYPYTDFTAYPWYTDHILLLVCQTVMIAVFALWVLTEIASILGIASILRSQLFLIWTLAMIPLASLLHLSFWWAAAQVVTCFPGLENWLKGQKKDKTKTAWSEEMRENKRWWRRWTVGQLVYWVLRIFLLVGVLAGTILASLEAASPYPLFGDG